MSIKPDSIGQSFWWKTAKVRIWWIYFCITRSNGYTALIYDQVTLITIVANHIFIPFGWYNKIWSSMLCSQSYKVHTIEYIIKHWQTNGKRFINQQILKLQLKTHLNIDYFERKNNIIINWLYNQGFGWKSINKKKDGKYEQWLHQLGWIL